MITFHQVAMRRAARCAAAGLACLLHAAGATSDPPAANPLGGGQSVTLEPAPPPASPRRHRTVFVCQDGDLPIYTDRPCGTDAAQRHLEVDSPVSGATATTLPPAPRASTRPRPAATTAAIAATPAPATKCDALQRQVDALNDRMRAGYSAREAARLWQRWRDARERLRQARC